MDFDYMRLFESVGVGGGTVGGVGAIYWFYRWTKNVDQTLRDMLDILRRLSEKTAVNESRLRDIDKIREKTVINEQRILAAHRRVDDLSNH